MATAPLQHRKIRVNRAFWYEGKIRNVGDELTLPAQLYAELVTAGKCELMDNEPSADHLRAKAEAKAKADAEAEATSGKGKTAGGAGKAAGVPIAA